MATSGQCERNVSKQTGGRIPNPPPMPVMFAADIRKVLTVWKPTAKQSWSSGDNREGQQIWPNLIHSPPQHSSTSTTPPGSAQPATRRQRSTMGVLVGRGLKQYLERRSERAIVGAMRASMAILECSNRRLYCILSTFNCHLEPFRRQMWPQVDVDVLDFCEGRSM